MGVKCFMVRPTNRWRLSMRRYSNRTDRCSSPDHLDYHNAKTAVLEVAELVPDADGYFRMPDNRWASDDPRWPVKCESCAYVFTDEDERQVFGEQVFVSDNGTEYGRRNLPPGAMYFRDGEPEEWRGPDGRTLHVICPDGWDWSPDHPCSNCTMKEDRGPFATSHRCWVRHGVAPAITVDKNGRTCKAGGGSIQTPKFHGFLRNGEFT